ncbi:DUF192 domain-containing protein [Pseudidiomarina sediminum]|uniref:DUF192 domain-containing protein n=1 Tax=Pseudidiomarina sediminum TaxID=431675 RepID=UPI000F89D12B|nr:DUF192 domain-containing protein [Pseudidiomarina sediminum]
MTVRTSLKFSLALFALSLPTASFAQQCTTEPDGQCSYTVAQLCLADSAATPLTLEVADTFGKRARGLMYRTELADHHGMWFVYDEQRPGYSGFWMHNTKIALDIAYLDAQMKVVKQFTMQPCTSVNPRNCPTYNPGVAYYSAVEMPAGYFKQHGITLGTQFKQCNNEETP